MESDIYIPKETILNIVDNLDIPGIEAFFSTNRELYSLINEPDALKHISDTKHLPYVSSFSNLVYFSRMSTKKILKYALKVGDLRLVKYLIDNGGKIEWNTVRDAASNGHLEIVKYLIDKGGNIERNTLEYAVKNRHFNVVKYLHRKMRNESVAFEAVDSVYTTNKMKKYIHVSGEGNLEIVKYLIEKGAKIDKYAINTAASNGNLDIVKYLLHRSATEAMLPLLVEGLYKPSTSSSTGTTNLIKQGVNIPKDIIKEAIESGNIDMVKYFEGLGYKIKKHDDSLLYYAIRSENPDMVKYVHKKVGKINKNDIYEAAYYSVDIMEYLIKNMRGVW